MYEHDEKFLSYNLHVKIIKIVIGTFDERDVGTKVDIYTYISNLVGMYRFVSIFLLFVLLHGPTEVRVRQTECCDEPHRGLRDCRRAAARAFCLCDR